MRKRDNRGRRPGLAPVSDFQNGGGSPVVVDGLGSSGAREIAAAEAG